MSRRSWCWLSPAATPSPWTARLHIQSRQLACYGHGSSTFRPKRNGAQGGLSHPRHFSHTSTRRRRRQPATVPPPTTTTIRNPPKKRKWTTLTATSIAALTTLLAACHFLLADPPAPNRLNKERFTPCTVVAREAVSPTAFLLTLRVPNPAANRPVLADAHRYGLWSVEVKQPQLQIARNYTPLPPDCAGVGGKDDELRFFVRRYETGEVSQYLARLAPGDTIEIRGPHLGFDLGARLGGGGGGDGVRGHEPTQEEDPRHVVFLAGGTGIAPAMQAARRLLLVRNHHDDDGDHNSNNNNQGPNVSVQILWANRASADCAGCVRVNEQAGVAGPFSHAHTWGQKLSSFFSGRGQKRGIGTDSVEGEMQIGDAKKEEEHPSLIMAQLKDLQAQYVKVGRELRVKCAIDEEGSTFTARDIAEAVTASAPSPSSSSSSSSSFTAPAGERNAAMGVSSPCFFHSQRQLQDSTEELDAGETGGMARTCTCDDGPAGRNLFIISGPEGFVRSYVGPKVWARGAERQGPVGGVVAELMRNNSMVWRHWLVLKQ